MRSIAAALCLVTVLTSCTGSSPTINAGFTPAQWTAFVATVWSGVPCPVVVTPAMLSVANAQSVATANEMQVLYGANYPDTVALTPAVATQVAAALASSCP